MFKTLRISFMLQNTYRTNTILHGIRQLPLIGKLIPETVYSMPAFKMIAYVLALICEVMFIFLWKFFYFLLVMAMWAFVFQISSQDLATYFFHIMIPMTFIGAFQHNFMFTAEKHKYYAMMQLNMNARQFTLVNYFYELAKYTLGFIVFTAIFGLLFGMHSWEIILFPIFAASSKTAVCGLKINRFKKSKKVTEANSLLKNSGSLLLLCAFIVAIYVLAAMGYLLPRYASWAIMAVTVIAALLSLKSIITFNDYRAMNKEILSSELLFQMDKSVQRKMLVDKNRKNISMDKSISSSKNGFEYLNELFIKRHKKVLWGSSVIITVVIGCLVALMSAACLKFPNAGKAVNDTMLSSLPYFSFIMYAVNRGMSFTQALFMNCDHSLLTYSFYKEPKAILTLFRIRLREIIKVNLLPAAVGGGGLALLLFLSGGTDNPINYAVLFVSICALSIFFSVHYLTIYYLLQPYNAGTEVKSGMYKVISFITYMVCFIFMNMKLPTLIFGGLTIIFCILYCIIACILVYKFAPKTFRIRN